ncbi:hypothetical protein K443DRAFT_55377, partial [Laccaria amethystina LaAM-08-1]
VREAKKGQRPNGGDPQSCHEVNTCVGLFLYTCKRCSDSLQSPPTGRVQVPIYLLRRVLTI